MIIISDGVVKTKGSLIELYKDVRDLCDVCETDDELNTVAEMVLASINVSSIHKHFKKQLMRDEVKEKRS